MARIKPPSSAAKIEFWAVILAPNGVVRVFKPQIVILNEVKNPVNDSRGPQYTHTGFFALLRMTSGMGRVRRHPGAREHLQN